MIRYDLAVRVLVLLALSASTVARADEPAGPYERRHDVIYGRLPGIALTMDVFTPKADAPVKANGAGIIWVISGGWASAHESIDNKFNGVSIADLLIKPLVERGYTVFAVVHASQPKYTIPEIIPQINRAVRFIRTHAKDYGIDENRIGIVGASAGGHLSLMQGLDPQPPIANAPDPVDRASSRVQAVAAFVPPTDFLNFGGPGINGMGEGPLAWLKAPFDFHELTTPAGVQAYYERITDEKRRKEIGRAISPIYHVDKGDAAILVLAGEKDRLVPLQQVQSLKAMLDEAGVPNELIVRAGADHAWPEMGQDMQKVADWYDEHLLGKPSKPEKQHEADKTKPETSSKPE